MDSLAPRIVLVDDDDLMRAATARTLKGLDFEVHDFSSADPALGFLSEHEHEIDVIVSDLHMPVMDGLAFLAETRRCWPDLPFVMLTADSSSEPAIEALRQGAYDHLTKPLAPDEQLRFHLFRAVERHRLLRRTRELERQRDVEARFEGIVGTSAAMRAVFTLVERVATTDATTLVLGESGTGKELVARAIHARSRRAAKPFLAVNCSALSETLLDSELFGHVKGAFSGATSSRRGLFEEASGGTLFLDEIGDIDASVQVRLLRALQEGEIKPVGSSDVRKVDVRIIAATNRDLAADVRESEFREDLYYRLNVVNLWLPPLRDRGDDVLIIAKALLSKYADEMSSHIQGFTPQALASIKKYTWPGNIRQLENRIKKGLVLCDRSLLAPEDLDLGKDAESPILPLEKAKEEFQRKYVLEVLERNNGNRTQTARDLGVDPRTIFRYLEREANPLPPGGSGTPES